MNKLLQHTALSQINSAIQSNRIGHAYLLYGILGVGKYTVSIQIAQQLNCKNFPLLCNSHSCNPCKKIAHENHPDIITIVPDGKSIKVSQIRSLLATMAMKPFEARYRIVIIRQADKMTIESQNSLLKFIEEPPNHTIVILHSENIQSIQSTILSRCQKIACAPPDINDFFTILNEDSYTVSPSQNDLLWQLSQGSITTAKDILESNIIEMRNHFIQILQNLETYDSIATSHEIKSYDNHFSTYLTLSLFVIRDLMLLQMDLNSIPPIYNKDIQNELNQLASDLRKNTLHIILHHLYSAHQQWQSNVNINLLLEHLLLSIKDAHANQSRQDTI